MYADATAAAALVPICGSRATGAAPGVRVTDPLPGGFAARDDACVDDRLPAFARRRGHSAIELSNVSMLASSVACVTAAPAAVVPAPDMSAVHPSKALAPSPV